MHAYIVFVLTSVILIGIILLARLPYRNYFFFYTFCTFDYLFFVHNNIFYNVDIILYRNYYNDLRLRLLWCMCLNRVMINSILLSKQKKRKY